MMVLLLVLLYAATGVVAFLVIGLFLVVIAQTPPKGGRRP